MTSRYFLNLMPDYPGHGHVALSEGMRREAVQSLRRAVSYALGGPRNGDPTLYTGRLWVSRSAAPAPILYPTSLAPSSHPGLAGIAHLCWRVQRVAELDSDVEAVLPAAELAGAGRALAQAALDAVELEPRRHHGWSLVLGWRAALPLNMAWNSYHICYWEAGDGNCPHPTPPCPTPPSPRLPSPQVTPACTGPLPWHLMHPCASWSWLETLRRRLVCDGRRCTACSSIPASPALP
jgi:hypothetical protein